MLDTRKPIPTIYSAIKLFNKLKEIYNFPFEITPVSYLPKEEKYQLKHLTAPILLYNREPTKPSILLLNSTSEANHSILISTTTKTKKPAFTVVTKTTHGWLPLSPTIIASKSFFIKSLFTAALSHIAPPSIVSIYTSTHFLDNSTTLLIFKPLIPNTQPIHITLIQKHKLIITPQQWEEFKTLCHKTILWLCL